MLQTVQTHREVFSLFVTIIRLIPLLRYPEQKKKKRKKKEERASRPTVAYVCICTCPVYIGLYICICMRYRKWVVGSTLDHGTVDSGGKGIRG